MAKDSHQLYGAGRIRRLAMRGIDKVNWYNVAQSEIRTICELESWSIVDFTNILSILSPRVSIRRNIRSAILYYGQNGQFFNNTIRGIRRSVELYRETGVIGGYKVPYFAAALLGDTESITLDTWMSYALQKVDFPSVSLFRRKATMLASFKLVRSVAKSLRITPRDCQACVWSGCFRESNREPQYFPILEEYKLWLSYGKAFPLVGTINDTDDTAVVPNDPTSFDYGF